MWPYTFPYTRSDFRNLIPAPSASLCSNFVSIILKLPLYLFQTFRSMFDENGNLTATFLSMIHSPGDIKTSVVTMTGVQKNVWLPCDGSLYPIATYPDLAAALGATGSDGGIFTAQTNPNIFTYDGVGNVVITPVSAVSAGLFRVPDWRGLVPMGVGNPNTSSFALGTGASISLGGTAGEALHRLIPGEDVPHTHTFPRSNSAQAGTDNGGASTTDSGWSGGTQVGNSRQPTLLLNPAGGNIVADTNVNAIAFKEENGTTIDYYAATPHNNIPPSLGCFMYIFAGVPVTAATTSADETLQPI